MTHENWLAGLTVCQILVELFYVTVCLCLYVYTFSYNPGLKDNEPKYDSKTLNIHQFLKK